MRVLFVPRWPVSCVRTGTLHHICQALEKTLLDPELQDVLVVYYTTQEPRDLTNDIYLLDVFLCLRLGATPEEAWGPFQSLTDKPDSGPMCLPYRDATWVKSPYDLHVKECWAGLVRAVATGLYNLQAFDKHEVRCFRCALMMMMSFICSCCNKIGAEFHIYLEEGTSHKRLFRGTSTDDMKK